MDKRCRQARTNARQRCNNPKASKYCNYGGRGIKCLITKAEIEALWLRDGADKMQQPSLDRIDNNGHYTSENCRFIEFVANRRRKRTMLVTKEKYIKLVQSGVRESIAWKMYKKSIDN